MNNQFIKLYTEFEEKGLKPNEISVLAHLYDRMNLSVNNSNFYDRKHNGYYVIYTREELSEQINLNASTITRIIKKLANLGWIIVKKGFNAPNRFFLPHFVLPKSYRVQNAPTEIAKCNTIQTDFNQTNNYTDNTVNTTTDAETEPVVDHAKQWAKATQQKVGLTFTALQAIQKFCKHNVEKCKQVVRLILNARNSVAKANRLVKQPVAQFESNQNIINGLAQQLEHIFSYAVKLPQSNYAGYVTNALKAYFTAAFGLETKPVAVKPTVKATKFNDGKKRIHEELPAWARDDYEFKADESVDMGKKAKLEAMLANI
ncbi:replication initiator protein A [Apilactobacillus xinyiensis]|uniref:replication initiator protein A n=1 Tax=Apilactobacillus xinyiensis TaxID=2841032 RepID=UPI001C7D627F|nr:replication initiator protein A [Apilactobacillus xinyiensis]